MSSFYGDGATMPAAGDGESRHGGQSGGTESALAASATTCENSAAASATNRRVPPGYGPPSSGYPEFSCALPPAFQNNSTANTNTGVAYHAALQNNNYLSYQDTSSVAALASTQANSGSNFLDLSTSTNCLVPSSNSINVCNRVSASSSSSTTALTTPMYPWMSIVGG